MAYESYRDLRVWQKAMDLVVEVYRITAQFPSDEKFGLTSQRRRAAVSIPSNIAEGHGRQSTREFANFLWIANGSLMELDTQITIAERLSFSPQEHANKLRDSLSDVSRMLAGLRNSLKKSSPP
jgi:four helix bundle protein